MQYVGEKDPDQLELRVYYGDKTEESELYEDAEQGYDYEKGDYRLTTFSYHPTDDTIVLQAERAGDFEPPYNHINITLIGLPFEPTHAIIDGEKVAVEEVKQNNKKAYSINVSPNFKTVKLEQGD
ncbi:MAG: DUF5110 domain-containing protein [Balneolaceae bacterium]|nr:DUF5110 domain-containing protein [Balneolaceae bacterium]